MGPTPVQAATVQEPRRPRGGDLLTAISNRIVGVLREHYGRGPMKAKTYVLDDLMVCVLRDGSTAIERTMVEAGGPERVIEMRRDFQQMMGHRYCEIDRGADRLSRRRLPQPGPHRA